MNSELMKQTRISYGSENIQRFNEIIVAKMILLMIVREIFGGIVRYLRVRDEKRFFVQLRNVLFNMSFSLVIFNISPSSKEDSS